MDSNELLRDALTTAAAELTPTEWEVTVERLIRWFGPDKVAELLASLPQNAQDDRQSGKSR